MTVPDGHSYLRLNSVNIYVREQERSLNFYQKQLGFEIAFDAQLQSGQRWVAVSPPDGTAVLTLIQPAANSPTYQLIGRPTSVVFVTDDVAHQYETWRKRGVNFRHAPRLRRIKYQNESTPVWGEVFTRFEDVDGNVFTLISLDQVSKALEAQRRENQKKLEAERRLAHELGIAREVQSRLFPQTFPECESLEYAGVCAQARQVGGDYYDYFSLAPGKLGLVIGDIAGKGIAAALLMSNLQAHLRGLCTVPMERPEQLLQSVNKLFFENTVPNAYATLFFGEYDDRLHTLRYINCGHLSGLVLRSDHSVQRLDSTCTVLGLFQQWECTVEECQLHEGDLLALYTDGVTEAANDAEEEFGEAGLLQSLAGKRHMAPREIVGEVLSEVQQYRLEEQHDDITLMVASAVNRSY